MDKKMQDRANKAVCNYFSRKGYDNVVDLSADDYGIGNWIKAVDGDQNVFSRVTIVKEFGKLKMGRSEREKVMVSFAKTNPNDLIQGNIRFDDTEVLVIGKDKALIRHTIGI